MRKSACTLQHRNLGGSRLPVMRKKLQHTQEMEEVTTHTGNSTQATRRK